MSVTQLNDMLPNRRQMTVEDDEFISVSEGRIRIRIGVVIFICVLILVCLLYTSPSPRDQRGSRMPSSA